MKFKFIFLSFIYLFLSNITIAIEICGVKTNDGRELICPDGFTCSFGNIKNRLNCKCKGYADNPFKMGTKYQIYTPCYTENEIQPQKPPIVNTALKSIKKEDNDYETLKDREKKKIEISKALVMSGDSYYQKGEYDQAILEWYKAIAVDNDIELRLKPFIARAYAKKGAIEYSKRNYESAIINFNESLRLNPYDENVIKAKNKAEMALEYKSKKNSEILIQDKPSQEKNSFEISSPKKLSDEKSEYKIIFLVMKVIGWLSIVSFIIFLPWSAQPILSSISLALFFLVNIFIPSFFGPLIVLSAIWLAYDSNKLFKEIPLKERKKVFSFLTNTGSWLTASFIFWPLFFPLYISKRLDYIDLKDNFNKENLKVKEITEEKANKQKDIEILSDLKIKEMVRKAEYDKAINLLSKKKDLNLEDYKIFLEIYIKIEDFIRAKLTLNKIIEEINLKNQKESDYILYLSFASLCRIKGQNSLSSQLRELAFEIMKKEIILEKNPVEFYNLALNFENDGDIESAIKVYKYFEQKNINYSDIKERLKKIQEKKNAPPAPQKTIQNESFKIIAGRYFVNKILGSGGMGVVYQATDKTNNVAVAVKQIHSSLKEYPEEFKRFIREAEIVKKLKHPNIVSVLDVIEDEGETYLVFDYVDGKNLAVILKEKVRLPLNECQNIIRDICDAVHYAHKNNIIHRDIKPANIMINSKNVVKIMDFGLACELKDSMTRVTHQTMSGTPAYMAPEQYEGIVKKESDIYAIGVCLYEMLTGELPFKTLDFQKDKKNRNYEEISAKLPWLPPSIDKIIDKALDPEPSMRYTDPLELWADFKEIK